MIEQPGGGLGDRSTSTLAGGAGLLIASRYATAAMGWTATVILVRTLPPQTWGGYAFVFSLLGIIGMVSDLYIGRLVLRSMLTADREEAALVATSYVAFRAAIGLVSYLVAVGVVVAGGYPTEVVQATALAGVVLIIASCGSAFEVVLQARLWIRDMAKGALAGQLAYLGIVVGLAATGQGTFLRFAAATVVVWSVDLLWKLRVVGSVLVRKVEVRRWGAWLREAAPLAIGSIMATVYFRIDSIMLSKLDSLTSVGVYNVGYKFSDLLGSLPEAVLTPALTVLVAAWPRDLDRFRAVFRQSFILLVVAGVGAAVGFAMFAEPAIALLYGERYTVVALAAKGLVLGQVVNFLTYLCFSTLVTVGRNRLYPAATIAGVAANIGLNLAFIPLWSYEGAALATIITEVLVLAVLISGTARLPGIRPLPWRAVTVTAMAAVAMASAGWALTRFLPWAISGLCSGAIYLVVLHALQVDGPGGLRQLWRPAHIASEAEGQTPPGPA